ncbi:MAG: YigZ family protein [Myxococcota bacterium]
MSARYRTLAAPFTFASDPVKGSRFVTVVGPAPDEAAAMAVVHATEAAHPGADHCCWAWRLLDGRSRSWDAAEPRGSAGRPILAQLEGHEVVNAVAVVVRYFGGTKLGVGGLIRAYGGAAGMALDRAEVVEVAATRELVIAYGYADTAAVEAALAGAPVTVIEAAYDASVTLRVRVEVDAAEALNAALRARTSGRVEASAP